MICQKTKCEDYSTDDGEPAWCLWVGCPAVVAVNKCPKITGGKDKKNQAKKGKRHEKQSN